MPFGKAFVLAANDKLVAMATTEPLPFRNNRRLKYATRSTAGERINPTGNIVRFTRVYRYYIIR